MKVYLKKSLNAIDKDAWDALVRLNPKHTVFQMYAWHRAWCEMYPPERSWWIVVAEENNRMMGILPLMMTLRNKTRVLKFMGTPHADYCDVMTASQDRGLLKTMFQYLCARKDEWDEMALDYVPEFSWIADQIMDLCRELKLFPYHYADTPCPVLLIDQDQKNLNQILAKKSLKRHQGYYLKQGQYRVQHLTQVKAILPYLEMFFKQHIDRRRSTKEESLFLRPENKLFYQQLLKYLGPSESILFTVVESQGFPIAFHFGFVNNRCLTWYKPSFDVAQAKHSPGEVLIKELLEYAREHNFEEFDFTTGKEAFKMRFTNAIRNNRSFKIFKNPARYWAHKAMTLAKRKIQS